MASKITYRLLDTQTEQPAILPLLADCFQAYWEQTAAQNGSFPFEEISIAAIREGQLVGHIGIIPQRMSKGNGHYSNVAGVASVAVLPEYRGQGIARGLGHFAREWARNCGYDLMALYTDKPQVYRAAGFVDHTGPTARTIVFDTPGNTPPRPGRELTEAEKAEILRLYAQGEDYRGRLIRGNGREFNGWKRLFQDPEYTFAVQRGIYATFYYDVLAECCFSPGLPENQIHDFIHLHAIHGRQDAALHAESRLWKAVSPGQIQDCRHDIMHGEHPMILALRKGGDASHIHFNLADKF